MKLFLCLGCFVALGWMCNSARAEETLPWRPPAIPLVAHDPYLSVWSFSDALPQAWTRHWTGAVQAMCGMARIDGKTYRFAGEQPAEAPAMNQVSMTLTPTATAYRFEAGGIELALSFLSPILPDDMDVLSRPLTYVTFEARSIDGQPHDVRLYFDITGEWAVDKPEQKAEWSRAQAPGMVAMRIGTKEQAILGKVGDDRRIDWGYAHLAASEVPGVSSVMASDADARGGFVQSGKLPDLDDTHMPRRADKNWPVLALAFDLGKVGLDAVQRHCAITYDDVYSIELMGQALRPYWRRNGMGMEQLLEISEKEFSALRERCARFDANLATALSQAGGPMYERMAVLAYRHSFAAQKIAADAQGNALMFPKENFSNGCIGTVDVIYPAAPIFLYLNTAFLKAQLRPVLDYAASPRWPWPFAPHDLGTYPKANGQVYGGGEETEENQMPVEESANMLLLLGAIAKADGNVAFSQAYWPVISRWAEYLEQKGLDPENQLCTDDFAGHLAHNANLSIKAILALGAYAQLCEAAAQPDSAARYKTLAQSMASQWMAMANDGDHYRLAFDAPGTWSQKYNLVWDTILGLHIFPPEVARKEVAHYLKVQNAYGLPLDNRKTYTKLDWLFWSASLAERREDFDALLEPAYRFTNDTPDRVPLTDWYDTISAKKVGFQARPVIGGLYIKMLMDEATWKGGASLDQR